MEILFYYHIEQDTKAAQKSTSKAIHVASDKLHQHRNTILILLSNREKGNVLQRMVLPVQPSIILQFGCVSVNVAIYCKEA